MGKTAAERQKAFRESMKKKGYRQSLIWVDSAGNPVSADSRGAAQPHRRDGADDAEAQKLEKKRQWDEELKAEKLKAARAEGRKLARQSDKTFNNGRISAFCDAAVFFITKHRDDIASDLLAHYYIDRAAAASVLQSDGRVKSPYLQILDKALVWNGGPSARRR
jgi:hypothetical protein